MAGEEGSCGIDVEGGRGQVVGDIDRETARQPGFGQAPRGPDQGCTDKSLTTSCQWSGDGGTPRRQGGEAPICSIFYGVNIPTTTNFKLPTKHAELVKSLTVR